MKKSGLKASLISIIIITSCSNKADPEDQTNSILGAWQPIREVDVSASGIEQIYQYSNCEQTGRTTFFKNGTFSMTAYDITEGHCEQYYSIDGTWKLKGVDLTLTTKDQTSNQILYALSNTILRVGDDANPINICNGENLSSHFYTEFIRVE